ncbi:hypothetical protein A3E15_01550 [Candidatus Woesebacteria bacterium RIFCSPHIGHO2_12_FULL_42_9]|uniref:Uncharacterized protein n=1 Tax=Candidatus Woesebacteria bacterium RIFCSPHIGHO2_12_FULL_42_9 TaxID=1802511 RepID=A0A1F8AX63_9BACT|nr:MAG: hypothetical protein A3E15_01550 [Candidatus Woesebacteria bacterium RIFCSPHIGHO2_12_FULL_42_9]
MGEIKKGSTISDSLTIEGFPIERERKIPKKDLHIYQQVSRGLAVRGIGGGVLVPAQLDSSKGVDYIRIILPEDYKDLVNLAETIIDYKNTYGVYMEPQAWYDTLNGIVAVVANFIKTQRSS